MYSTLTVVVTPWCIETILVEPDDSQGNSQTFNCLTEIHKHCYVATCYRNIVSTEVTTYFKQNTNCNQGESEQDVSGRRISMQ